MTSRPDFSAASTRTFFVAAGLLSAYLFVAFTGCSDASTTQSRYTETGGGSGQSGSGTASGSTTTGSTTTGGNTTGSTTTGGNTTGSTTTGGSTTGGTAGGSGSTTGSAGSTGAAGAGSGGAGGRGGAGGTGGAGGGNSSGCTGNELPPGNRCTMAGQPIVGQGNELLIDDLEPAAGDILPSCHKIRAVDGRTGSWNSGKDDKSPAGSVVHSFEPAGAPRTGRAVHIVGQGLNGYGGYLAVPLAPCYNAAAYKGLSFWLKGDPAKVPWLKLSVMTPQSVEAAQGGSCIQPPVGHLPTVLECYDNFSIHLFKVSNIWTRYAITWQQLAQYGWGQPIPNNIKGETQIIGLNFSPVWNNDAAANKAFDFWVDDLSFNTDGPFTDTGFKSIITQQQFESAYTGRAGFFSDAYAQLAAALDDPRFSRIGREGTAEDRKREIAALMAHIWQETGGLASVTEVSPPEIYCRPNDPLYPCAPGQTYIGRGPLQLSWNYNYGQAGDYLGISTLLSNPGQVATDRLTSWRSSMFFWMAWKDKDKNSLLVGPHYRFLHDGFGGSIRAINGALECGAGNAAADNRRRLYQQYCTMLGVTGCDQMLVCPPT